MTQHPSARTATETSAKSAWHAVVFSGKLLPGHDAEQVRPRLQVAFRLGEAQAERLFSGQPVTIKRGLCWADAEKYQSAFRRMGALLMIHPDPKGPANPSATPASAPAPSRPSAVPATPAPDSPLSAAPPCPSYADEEPDEVIEAIEVQSAMPIAPPKPATRTAQTKTEPVETTIDSAPATPKAGPSQPRIPTEALTVQDQLRLNLTAAAMLLLPVLYLGVLVLLVNLLFNHVTDFSGFAERNPLSALLGYLLPSVLLGLLAYLWLEPVLPRREQHDEGLELSSNEQPELHAWASRLCRTLDIPVPSRLRLSLSRRSQVELSNGLTSLWHRDLCLNLSANQLAGLDEQQLTGVVGHELARFGQWQIMKLAYLIDGVHGWFERGVERESLLAGPLNRLSESEKTALAQSAHYGLIGLTYLRKPLEGLLKLSGLLSRPVLRDVVFRADRSAAQLYGHTIYAETLVQAAWLAEADELAEAKNWQAWAEGRLVDDRISLTLRFARASDDALNDFRQELIAEDTSVWSRQPTIGERLDALSREMDQSGVFHGIPGPKPLLARAAELAKQLTDSHYHAHGIGAEQGKRVDASEMLTLTAEQDEALAALERYFEAWHRPERFLPLPGVETLAGSERSLKIQLLQEALDELRKRMPDIDRLYSQFDGARSQVRQLLVARSRLDADGSGSAMELKRVENALEGANSAMNGRLIDIQTIESLLSQRLAWGLSLAMAEHPQGTAQRLPAMFQTLRGLHRLQPSIDELTLNAGIARDLEQLPGVRTNTRLLRDLRARQKLLQEQLRSLRGELATLPNPLGDEASSTNLVDSLSIGPLGQEPTLAVLLEHEQALCEQLRYFNRRLTGELARLAEPAEERFAVRPLRSKLKFGLPSGHQHG